MQLNIAGAAGTTGITNYGATVRGPNTTVTHVNVMDVNGNTTIDTANSSGDLHLTGAWSGSGTINVINFGNAARTLTLGGGSMANFTGTIRVIRLRPAITEFGMNGSNFFLNGTNGGNTSTHYIIVTATDLTVPLASWTPVVTNLFGGGNFTLHQCGQHRRADAVLQRQDTLT